MPAEAFHCFGHFWTWFALETALAKKLSVCGKDVAPESVSCLVIQRWFTRDLVQSHSRQLAEGQAWFASETLWEQYFVVQIKRSVLMPPGMLKQRLSILYTKYTMAWLESRCAANIKQILYYNKCMLYYNIHYLISIWIGTFQVRADLCHSEKCDLRIKSSIMVKHVNRKCFRSKSSKKIVKKTTLKRQAITSKETNHPERSPSASCQFRKCCCRKFYPKTDVPMATDEHPTQFKTFQSTFKWATVFLQSATKKFGKGFVSAGLKSWRWFLTTCFSGVGCAECLDSREMSQYNQSLNQSVSHAQNQLLCENIEAMFRALYLGSFESPIRCSRISSIWEPC